MARSAFVEVNITNPTKLAQDSQDTANSAVKGITNLNDPNLMSVIEKQNNVVQFAGLTSQYNVLVQNAKDEGIDTTAVTTAYNNLNKFMADVLADPDHASDVDRVTYKKYQDAYNEELAKLQSALQNNTNNKFTSAASATSQAASIASQAASQAQSAVDYTNSQIASQASAVSEASKNASEASSQANSALDMASGANTEITKLKGGSTLTIAELESGLGTKVSNDTFTTYQTQTASQFAETVKEADFTTYQTQTSKLIESKVDNGTYQTDKTQTAKDIASKVSSSDFETYQTQTDGMIASKVSKKDANNVNLIPYSSNFSDSLEGWQLMAWGATDRKLLVTTHSYYKNGTGKLLYLNTAQNATSAAGSLRFSVLPNTKYTFQFKAFASSNVVGANVYFLSRAYGSTSDYDTVHGLFNNLVTSPSHIDQYTVTFTTGANDNEGYIRVDNIGSNNGASSGLFFTELKMEPGDTATNYIYGGQDSMISQMSNDIILRVTKDDLIDQINIQAGNTLISSSGQLTLSGKSVFLDSVDPVIMKSANIDTLLVGKKLTAADIAANTFTTNNGTFTVDKNGLVTATSLIIRGSTNLVYNASLSGGNGSYIPGWNMNGEGYYSDAVLYDGVPGLAWNGTAATGVWDNYATTYYQPVTQTGIPYSASGTFRDYGSASGMMFQCTLAFFTDKATASRINGYKSFNYTATGGDSGSIYFTIDNVVAPSNAKYVALQFWAYNGKGHAAWSQPMLTQTAKATGYQPDTGNIVSAGTVIGTNISGSIINGTTFHGGDVINDANNTSKFYPTTISSDGHIYTVGFNSADAMQTDLSTGSLTTKYRAVNSTSNNQYEAYDTLLEANQIVLSAGHTNGKDMSFSQSISGSNRDGYVLISPLDGITLHGDSQWIRFNGYANDSNPSGIVMTPWGNINPQGNQTDWYVGNKNSDKTAQFGIDSGHQVTINFYRATFVDEIGALGNRLDNGRLLLHAVDGNAQMYLLNDGSPAVASPTIYNRTYSNAANVYVTSYGRLGRATSASKYKLAIARSDDTLQADRLMTLSPASWNDKVATEKMAESLSSGEIPVEEEINLKRHYGLIAEDLRDAGLDEFLITGKDGQIEGIEYDRLWTVLIPKIKQLNNRINELERKTL